MHFLFFLDLPKVLLIFSKNLPLDLFIKSLMTVILIWFQCWWMIDAKHPVWLLYQNSDWKFLWIPFPLNAHFPFFLCSLSRHKPHLSRHKLNLWPRTFILRYLNNSAYAYLQQRHVQKHYYTVCSNSKLGRNPSIYQLLSE